MGRKQGSERIVKRVCILCQDRVFGSEYNFEIKGGSFREPSRRRHASMRLSARPCVWAAMPGSGASSVSRPAEQFAKLMAMRGYWTQKEVFRGRSVCVWLTAGLDKLPISPKSPCLSLDSNASAALALGNGRKPTASCHLLSVTQFRFLLVPTQFLDQGIESLELIPIAALLINMRFLIESELLHFLDSFVGCVVSICIVFLTCSVRLR